MNTTILKTTEIFKILLAIIIMGFCVLVSPANADEADNQAAQN
jgi:hypothetical protein